MAKLRPDLGLNGPLGNISFYTRWDMPGVVLTRTKGGAERKKIKTAARFQRTRELNAEFSGRATASKWIMQAMWPQKALADYNIAGSINTLMRPIQALDTEGKHGERHVMLSKNPKLLEGFSLNKRTGFDSIVRNSVPCSLSRETLSAQINIPALLPGINLYPPKDYSMYSIIAVMGVVPDLFLSGEHYKPSTVGYEHDYDEVATDWFSLSKGSPAQVLHIQADTLPPNGDFSLMLTIGIRFGTMIDANTIQQVKRAGAAKILAMA